MLRLRKQRVEAKQILDVILERPRPDGKPRKGWKNHPAAVMWEDYPNALKIYYNISLAVYAARGGNNIKLQPEPVNSIYIQPWWIGLTKLHDSHKSRLHFKGKLDAITTLIKRHFKCRSIYTWLENRGFPPLNQFRTFDYVRLVNSLNKPGLIFIPVENYYDQFDWKIQEDLDYYWPGAIPF